MKNVCCRLLDGRVIVDDGLCMKTKMNEKEKLSKMSLDDCSVNRTPASSSGKDHPTCSSSVLGLSSDENETSDPLKHQSSSANHSSDQSHGDPSKQSESSCNYSTQRDEESTLDVNIRTKINDLNQTFLRIINSLKIMNVHNRNSGRNDLNSNSQVLSLFDDFLNVSHLLNIKINYLYDTYVSRSEMKKYISSINYKLYVFNINSFELSQGIDKENKKHKKYQILHDLNISEMTNNVKLFNFVDDVTVNPSGSQRDAHPSSSSRKDVLDKKELETGNVESTEPTVVKQASRIPSASDELNEKGSHSNTEEKQYTKRLKRKTESHLSDSEDSDARLKQMECTSKVFDSNTKKLKTIELNPHDGCSSESVAMFNNLFQEINSNILELSKDIDVLNGYLKKLTPSPSCKHNEEDTGSSEDEEEELKKQTLADQKLKKWQITQMTRSLIDNMVSVCSQ